MRHNASEHCKYHSTRIQARRTREPEMGQGPEHSGVVSPAPPQYPAAHGPSQATEAEPSALYEPAAQITGVEDVAPAAQ